MIRGALILLGVLLLGVALTQRLAPRAAPADLRFVNSSEIHTLDPARMSWTQDLRMAVNLWEGLSAYDPDTLAPIAGSAEFPPEVSPDGLEWTFHLRPDARWSNGDAVLAGDFIRGWRRAIEPGTAADYAFFITDFIEGARDYASWRAQAAQALTAASRRSDGWPLTPQQFQVLRDAEGAESVRQAWRARTGSSGFARDVDELESAGLEWKSLHLEMLRAHAGSMESRFGGVGLRAPDERTLVIRLTKPCPYLADLVAFPSFSPIHASIEALRSKAHGLPITEEGLVTFDPQWTKPDYHRDGYAGLVTNGPYRLAAWTFKQSARLEVNRYYRDAPTLGCRAIEAVVYEDPNTALLAYESGDVDFIPTLDVSYDHEIARLARTGQRQDFYLSTLAGTCFFNFNCVDPSVEGRPNPFVDARVRRAFCLAVDRRAIVEQVLQRGDRPASAFVPPQTMPGYEPPAGLAFDPEQARALLSEAGFPGGRDLPVIELLFNTSGPHGAVCQAAARMWELHLGARIELRGMESKSFADAKAKRKFLIARANWYADYNDPTTFLDVLVCGNGNNDSGYASAEYDALLAEASRQRDATLRLGLLERAERIAVERDCPILPLFHYTSVAAIRPCVSGLKPNARLLFSFRGVSVSK